MTAPNASGDANASRTWSAVALVEPDPGGAHRLGNGLRRMVVLRDVERFDRRADELGEAKRRS